MMRCNSRTNSAEAGKAIMEANNNDSYGGTLKKLKAIWAKQRSSQTQAKSSAESSNDHESDAKGNRAMGPPPIDMNKRGDLVDLTPTTAVEMVDGGNQQRRCWQRRKRLTTQCATWLMSPNDLSGAQRLPGKW